MHRETFVAKLSEIQQNVEYLLAQLQASEHDAFAAHLFAHASQSATPRSMSLTTERAFLNRYFDGVVFYTDGMRSPNSAFRPANTARKDRPAAKVICIALTSLGGFCALLLLTMQLR